MKLIVKISINKNQNQNRNQNQLKKNCRDTNRM